MYSLQKLLAMVQKEVNQYVRLRDTLEGGVFRCICCSKIKDVSMMHASHLFSQGHHSSLRFDENNINGGCSACNTHLHGNLLNYRANLIKKIGEDAIQDLENRSRMIVNWDKTGLVVKLLEYRERNKRMRG